MEKKNWIIDTDAGVDDCQALVLALTNPQIEVVAITIVAGNVELDKVIKNTAETLRICNKVHVPYYVGSRRPLVSKLVTAKNIHGEDGINGYWDHHVPQDLPLPANKTAAEAILEYANVYKGNINIITIGPLTNLAIALALDPLLPEKFNRVVVMGGSIYGIGNKTITGEFNFYVDPEAAYIVLDRFPLIELVSWETCIRPENSFPAEFLREYTSGTTQIGKFISEITQVDYGISFVKFCDALAMVMAIDSSVVTKSSLRNGSVELTGTLTRGMGVIEWREKGYLDPTIRKNLLIVELFDLDKVSNILLNSIR
jgi:purine nucleosidase